jgi:positive regulator of sigma E activity
MTYHNSLLNTDVHAVHSSQASPENADISKKNCTTDIESIALGSTGSSLGLCNAMQFGDIAIVPRLEMQAKLRSIMIYYLFPLILLDLISTLKMGLKCSHETSWYIRSTGRCIT